MMNFKETKMITKNELNTFINLQPSFTESGLTELIGAIVTGKFSKETSKKLKKFDKEFPIIELEDFDFDPNKKMSKETKNTLIFILLDLLNYCRTSEFVQYLKKSKRVDYLLDDLISNSLTTERYTNTLASLHDFYQDWINGDTSEHEDGHRIPPRVAINN